LTHFNLTVKQNTLKLFLSTAILLISILSHSVSGANQLNDLNKKAFNFLVEGKLNVAIQTYLKVLKVNPDSAKTHHYLGFLYYQIGMGAKAIDHFNKAKLLYKNSTDQKSNSNLSIIENNLEKAYKKLALNPEDFSVDTLMPATQGWKPSGIGFFIGKQGNLLTTASSVQRGEKFRIRFSNGITEPVVLVRELIVYKIAILKLINTKNYFLKPLSFEKNPHFEKGNTVYTMDYSKLQNPNPSMHKGFIVKENALENSDKMVQLDLKLTKNRNGGPLFNKSGKVIGLLLGKSIAEKSFSYLKNTSKNSSFAIKSSYLKKIMPQLSNKTNKNKTINSNFYSGINVKNISKEAINSFVFLDVFN